ncbi:hypothetical protein B0H11DRAFT_1017811 [Mycena galericulata]|nr:hypothetical protein B0H11DRAFT_1017811 [Mycena galericulata]
MDTPYTFSFPEDLERLIFEQAASDDRTTACRLALVARRVQSWIEPIIYRSIILTSATLAPFASKSPEFYRRFVKQLRIVSRVQNMMTILSLCQGVTDLCLRLLPAKNISGGHPLDSPIGNLRLRRLDALLTTLLHGFPPEFDRPFYSNITHLIIVDDWSQWKEWRDLCNIPHLSHLMIEFYVDPDDPLEEVAQSVIYLLRGCASLQVFVFVTFEPLEANQPPGENAVLTTLSTIGDARVVVFQWLDDTSIEWAPYWETTANMWPSAEAQVMRRRALSSLADPKDLLFVH